ncbi:MAG TPA: DUF4846 domain-containing protein [Chitinophagaceae bacterium]
MSRLFIFSVISFFIACQWQDDGSLLPAPNPLIPLKVASDIAPPLGYSRVKVSENSFEEWLREVPVRKDSHVYLYNGALKQDQSVQYAVLDITVGKKDLQQCADAVMRLRAEYLFSKKEYAAIEFRDNAGKAYKWTGGADRQSFDRYLETVFGWCGSASLEKQLKPVAGIKDIQPGDVFIKGGFPGHAMIVMDVAVNGKGNKVFILAQSYMPAQDIHIVRNPRNEELSPWYEIDDSKQVITPEWTFSYDQLKRW